jgi:hypothetical protein
MITTHTRPLTHNLTHIHPHTPSLTLTLTPSYTHPHTQSHTLTHPHTQSHTTHPHSLPLSYTHTHSLAPKPHPCKHVALKKTIHLLSAWVRGSRAVKRGHTGHKGKRTSSTRATWHRKNISTVSLCLRYLPPGTLLSVSASTPRSRHAALLALRPHSCRCILFKSCQSDMSKCLNFQDSTVQQL